MFELRRGRERERERGGGGEREREIEREREREGEKERGRGEREREKEEERPRVGDCRMLQPLAGNLYYTNTTHLFLLAWSINVFVNKSFFAWSKLSNDHFFVVSVEFSRHFTSGSCCHGYRAI